MRGLADVGHADTPTMLEVAQARVLQLRRRRLEERVDRYAKRAQRAMAAGRMPEKLRRQGKALERDLAAWELDSAAFFARVDARPGRQS